MNLICFSPVDCCAFYKLQHSPSFLNFSPIWNPLIDRDITSFWTIGSSPISSSSYCCNTRVRTVLILQSAYFLPMQSLIPALKGMYANGCVTPKANLSGSKTVGFLKYFGFCIIIARYSRMSIPTGIIRPSSEKKYHLCEFECFI